ncbi:hypothetical protein LPJ73_008752, partial [Coemansia sp. RSA 2703]
SSMAAGGTPGASSRPPPVSTTGLVVAADSVENSPTIESSTASPVIGSNGVSVSEVPDSSDIASSSSAKQKGSVAKNSARGSRKNSPQPKAKKGASASVEPEAEPSTSKTKSTGLKGKSKKALAAAAAAAAASEKDAQDTDVDADVTNGTPSEAAEADVPEITNGVEQQIDGSSAVAESSTKTKLASKNSTPSNGVDEDTTKASTSKEKKGAKGSRKTPAPKEKKPRAKSKAALAKAAAAEAAAAAAAAVASESSPAPASSAARSQSPDVSKLAVANTGAAGSVSKSAGEDDTPLVQSPALASPTMTVNNAEHLMSPQSAPGMLPEALPPAIQQMLINSNDPALT